MEDYDKTLKIMVTILLALICFAGFKGCNEVEWQRLAISAVEDAGVKIRDDAVINSPAIMFKVGFSDFVRIAEENALDAFFIKGTRDNPGNRLVLVLNAEVGFIYEIYLPQDASWWIPTWREWEP